MTYLAYYPLNILSNNAEILNCSKHSSDANAVQFYVPVELISEYFLIIWPHACFILESP